jgi:hypothetical protein
VDLDRLNEALDEPVRRYFAHALGEGAATGHPMRLTMRGRIKVGAWLPFTARQESSAEAFEWRARVAIRRLTLLSVVDRFAAGSGSMEGRAFGRARLFAATGEDTTRSAAGRVALEAAAFAPACLLGHPGVAWRAVGEDEIVASWSVPPEYPEVRIAIDAEGAIRSVSALRWNGEHGYVPCGAHVERERRFGAYVLPARVTVGWGFGTPRYAPFFEAEITSAAPV